MRTKLSAVLSFLTSLVSILAIVVGVPALLIGTVGNPLPSEVPTIDRLREVFTQGGQDFSNILSSALAIMLWVVWAQILIALVVEIVSAVRRVETRQLPILPGLQGLAARLIAGLTLAATLTAGPLVGAAGAVVPPSPVVAIDAPALIDLTEDVATPATPVSNVITEAVAEVRPGGSTLIVEADTDLWKLAEEVYGDGTAWRDIASDNSASLDSEGRRIDDTTTTIPAGTRLVLSQEADQDAAAEFGTIEVEVEAGDSMWSLTEAELRNELGRAPTNDEVTARWEMVVSANATTIQSGDPDLLYPGETLTIPSPAAAPVDAGQITEVDEVRVWTAPIDPAEEMALIEAAAEAAAAAAAAAEAAPVVEEPAEVEVVEQEPAEVEVVEEPAVDTGVPMPPPGRFLGDVDSGPPTAGQNFDLPNTTSAPSAGSGDAASGDASEDMREPAPPVPDVGLPAQPPIVVPDGSLLQPDEVSAVDAEDLAREEAASTISKMRWELLLAGSLVLIAGAWAAVRSRRRRVYAQRPNGMVPVDDSEDVEAFEQAAGGARASDAGGRSAAVMQLTGALLPLIPPDSPSVLALIAEDDQVHILWDGDAPDPVIEDVDVAVVDERWTFNTAVIDQLPTAPIVALPALMTLGRTGSGNDVLVNLEGCRRFDVGGTRDDVESFAVRAAVELALSPLSDFGKVYCVGFGSEIASLPKVKVVDSIDEVLPELEHVASSVRDAVGDGSVLDVRADRSRDGLEPVIVLDLSGDETDGTTRLVAAASESDGGVSMLSWGDTAAEWAMTIQASEVQVGGILNTTLKSIPLDPDLLDLVVKIVDESEHEYVPSEDLVESHVAARIETETAGHGYDDDGSHVSTLSFLDQTVPPAQLEPDAGVFVRVLGPVSATGAYLTGKNLELTALMLANGGRITQARIAQLMYPNIDDPSASIRKLLERCRSALGTTEDGTPRLGLMNDATKEYELTDVTSDLIELMNVMEQIRDDPDMSTADAAELIDAAVQLVDGEPYSGAGTAYEWAMEEHGVAVRGVDDLCRSLASMYSMGKAYPRAKWAIRQGLQACIQCEPLYHTLLDVVIATDDQAELRAVWTEIETVFEGDVPDSLTQKYTQHLRRSA